MDYILCWNDDGDKAYGCKDMFTSKKDFIEKVKAEYKSFDGKDCIVKNVRVEPCIETLEGIPADMIVPLSATDITITNYYTADVLEVSMKYFEVQEPYYALIKASNKEEAIMFYTETVATDEEDILKDEIKELEGDTALEIYTKSMLNPNAGTISIEEIKRIFREEKTDLLLIDTSLQ